MSHADDNVSANCAELEISIAPAGPTGTGVVRWCVELRVRLPHRDATVCVADDGAALDEDSLLACDHNAARYGAVLTRFLFGRPTLLAEFVRARSAAERLRIRLSFRSGAERMQRLRWETLRDPERPGSSLLTDPRIWFSRFMSGTGERAMPARMREALSALLVVASPSDLADYGMSTIDVDAELTRLRSAVGQLPLKALASGNDRPPNGRATLGNILAALREGHDVLVLVGHGRLPIGGRPALFLEDDHGRTARVGGDELVRRILELERRPRLVALVACESAGPGECLPSAGSEAIAAIAEQLVEAGIPAVLAMQGRVRARTVEQLMPVFVRELLVDGIIDRALAAARAAIDDPDEMWRPMLLMHLQHGQLWREPDSSDKNDLAVAPELYFRPWLEERSGHHHRWTLVGREKLCGEIIDTIVAGPKRVVLLEGRGGIGKSRLVLELSRRLQDRGVRVFAYQDGSVTEREQLRRLPTGSGVLLFDDAHRIHPDELTLITEFTARQRPELTLVFACRPNGVEPITRACAAAGRGFDAVFHCAIPNLSEAARINLAAEALGSEHDPTLLASAFPDAPLFITVGGSLIRAGRISLEQMRRSDDLRELVLSHFPYKAQLREQSAPNADMNGVLGITALLAPLPSQSILLVQDLSGLEPEAAQKATDSLYDLGILEDINGRLRILPDLYGSHAMLAWALPRGVSLGRVHALWGRLSDDGHRHAMLRNLLELLRDIASPARRAELRGELRAIWMQCVQARREVSGIEVHHIDRYLEMMAGELASEAIDLAERLIRDARDAAAPDVCVELVRTVILAVDDPIDPVRVRGVDLLVRLAQERHQQQSRELLQELARQRAYAEEISEAVEHALDNDEAASEFVTTAIDVLSATFCILLNAACEGHRVPDLLSWHRRVGLRLVAVAMARPWPNYGHAFWSLVRTFVIRWERWARVHGESYDACKESTLTVLEVLERGLAESTELGRRFSARRALREGAGAVSAELAQPIFALIRRQFGDFDAVIDAFDPAFVPLEISEARSRERPQDRYSADIEGIRGRFALRLLKCAPDLASLDEMEPLREALAEITVTETLLANPVRLIHAARQWLDVTIEQSLGTEALEQAFRHRYTDAPELNPRLLAMLYHRTRLDESYVLAVARHSEAVRAVIAAQVFVLGDLRALLHRARAAARLLLAGQELPDELWRHLQSTAAALSSGEAPRYFALLYALVQERPTLAEPVARCVVQSGIVTADTLSPILHSLHRHAPAAALSLAVSLVEADVRAATVVASLLTCWIAGEEDWRELLRALLRHPDAEVSTRACTAAGVLMAVHPKDGREFVDGPQMPRDAAQLGAWMDGFTTGQIASRYVPEVCSHIDEIIAPTARAFAAKIVFPGGATDVEDGTDRVGERLTRMIAGVGAPAWDSFPQEVMLCLVRAIVVRGTLEHGSCQTYLVECTRRWPRAALACFLDAAMNQARPLQPAIGLVEAMLRPLANPKQIDVVIELLLDRARRERERSPAGVVTPWFASAALGWIAARLVARIQRDRQDEETLLDVAHLLRTLDLSDLINYRALLQLLDERYSERSPRYRRGLARIFADCDLKVIERKIDRFEAGVLESLTCMVTSIRDEVHESSPVRALYGRVLGLLHQRAMRLRREAEA